MHGFCIYLLSILLSATCLADAPGLNNADQVIPDVEAIFDKTGIGRDYSSQGLTSLSRFLEGELAYYSPLQNLDKKDPRRKLAKDIIPFYEYATKLIEQAVAAKQEEGNRRAFHLAKRVVTSTLTLDLARTKADYPEAFPDKPWSEEESGFWKAVLASQPPGANPVLDMIRSIFAAGQTRGFDERSVRLLRRARHVLIPKANVQIPVTDVTKSLEEFSKYSPSDAHPVWYNEIAKNKIGTSAKARWEHLEQLYEKRVSDALELQYSLKTARQVLRFKEIKDSATSPKIEAEDAYGQEWKLKWGDETQPEVISNRLYVALGGKFADLTYNAKAGELILILPKEKSVNGCTPLNAEELAQCLLQSQYKYNVKPNILASGVIDENFFEKEIAGKLPKGAGLKGELLGSIYVTFKESMVEFGGKKVTEKGGAPAYSSEQAVQDPIARSLVLFNMWIGSRDSKDDNNRAILLKLLKNSNPPGLLNIDKTVYLETQHDLGHSMGQIYAAGEIASMAGQTFITTGCSPQQKAICFNEALLYLPQGWKKATVADLLFMAKNIVNFMRPYLKGYDTWHPGKAIDNDLYWIASQTSWPEFMKLALIAKMTERTLGIIKTLNEIGISQLGTMQDFKSFVFDYQLSAENARALAREINLTEVADIEQLTKFIGSSLVKNGELEKCETPAQNPLIDFLQKIRFPSGLSKRISRLNDDQTTVGCDSVRGDWRLLLAPTR